MTRKFTFATSSLTALIFLCAMSLSACTEEGEDSKEENNDEYFEDVPEAYVLTDQTVAASRLLKTDEYGSTYRIRNASELKYLIDAINSEDGTWYEENSSYPTFQLEHDIEIDDSFDWEPIGSTAPQFFQGEFDGMGHRITGTLNIRYPSDVEGSYVFAGLFGRVNGEINNLVMDADVNVRWGVTADTPDEQINVCVGAIAGGGGWSFSQCTVNGEIALTQQSQAYLYTVGGVCGASDAKFDNCTMNGAFKLGELTDKAVAVGGICGSCIRFTSSASSSSFEQCKNLSDITLDKLRCDQLYVGGVLGWSDSSTYTDSGETEFSECENEGDIRVTNVETLYDEIPPYSQSARYHIGGLAGQANLKIREDRTRNVNRGEVYAENLNDLTNVGGVGGSLYGNTVADGTNEGNVTNLCKFGATGGCAGRIESDNFIEYFSNSGNVKSATVNVEDSPFSGWTGGIVGSASGQIHNCTSGGNIEGIHAEASGYDYVGLIAGDGHVYSCCSNNEGTIDGRAPEAAYENFVGWNGALGYIPPTSAGYVLPCEESH